MLTFSVSGLALGLAVDAAALPVVVVHVARVDRLGERLRRVDLAGALGGVLVGEQGLLRDLDVRRVADVLPAVGEGQRARLEVVVQRVGVGHAAQVEALEDVQRLADGGAAGGGRRHPVDVEPAVADVGRRLLLDAVAREVAGVQVAGRDRQVGVGALRRVLRRARDLLGERTVVERPDALLRDQPVGRGEVGVAQDRPDRGRLAAGQEELAGGGEVREPALVLAGLEVERRVDLEAPVGESGRRLRAPGRCWWSPSASARCPRWPAIPAYRPRRRW